MEMPQEVLDRLYSAPLDEFVATRNDIAAEQKKEGNDNLAAAVKKVRKPGLPLWTLNRLGRAKPDLVARLLTTAGELRDALERGDADAVRAGNAQRRKAVADLLDAATDELTAAGHAAGRELLERVSRSLMAASADGATGDALAQGRLTEEPTADDVGWGAVIGVEPDPDETPAAQDRRADLTVAAEDAQRKASEAAAEADVLEREAERAEKAAERAASRAADARRAAERLQRAADDAMAKIRDS